MLALVTERAAFRPLRRADPTTLLISSFAVSFFLQKLLILVVGSRLKGLDFLPALGRQIEFAGVRLQMLQIATIIVSVVLLVALTWFLQGRRGSACTCARRPRISAWRGCWAFAPTA